MKLIIFSLQIMAIIAVMNVAGAATPLHNRIEDSWSGSLEPPDSVKRIKHFRLDKNQVAIDGYDPVSYFKRTGPIKGKSNLAFEFNGVFYWFATTENLTTFKNNPTQYEPAWGGWCGHAMALRGEKVEINPVCYKIVNGRNVLFFKTFYANALTNWEKELQKTPEQTLMTQGDNFWKKTLLK